MMSNAEKMIEVPCSFCGKTIESPESMLESKQHACYACFVDITNGVIKADSRRIHVDAPTEEFAADYLAASMTGRLFPKVWNEAKQATKELSRKELAMQMFAAGGHYMATGILELQKRQKRKRSP